MIALAVVALLCATTLRGVVVVTRALTAKWDADRKLRDRIAYQQIDEERTAEDQRLAIERRRVAVEERRIALEEKQREKPPAEPPMPQALHDRINAWDDDFAKEAERTHIMELYALHRDWDKVMQSLPVLSPIMQVEISAPREGLVQ